MSKKLSNPTIPPKSELTGDVEKILCTECRESYLFSLRNKDHEFSIGLTDVLRCLRFAEEQGAVPPISGQWWIDVIDHYQID